MRMTLKLKCSSSLGDFQDRGYSHGCIRKAKERAFQTDRKDLLTKSRTGTQKILKQAPIRTITKYRAQWEQVKTILIHHWHILAEAPILGNIVGDRPLLMARRSPNLKDNLVHSEYQKPTTQNCLTDLSPLKGMYPCGKCNICRYVDKTDVFTNSDGSKHFKINNFINCSTTRVIYMLTCPCGMSYVGKIKRQKVRVGEHIQSIIKKDDECPLQLHFLKVHGGEPKGLKCKGIYRPDT